MGVRFVRPTVEASMGLRPMRAMFETERILAVVFVVSCVD